ncbi:hypothetical protein FA95DRAFT_981020 [Auriscalpium vulgare]|uniref:Uncharacterized protein n=1 Tax=Auriscalpium vulgare TaxID=40419 RepID=A0ACB8RYW5_9AGAM|nr:hypothetical protein FA95DRAFT_981020 [Auriscalpium vulgare]
MIPPHDVYRDELLSYGYGQAIWEPAPNGRQPAVLLGDVGYFFLGGFQRLFNIHLPPSHRFQSSTMPEHFEPLPIDDTMIIYRHLEPGAYCSTSVTVDGSSAPVYPAAGGEVLFTTTKQRGAVLVLPEQAQRLDVGTSPTYESYIAKHCDLWLAYAHQKGYGVDLEDILLVTGCDLAKSWAVTAFISSEVDGSATLKGVDPSTLGDLSAPASMQWRNWHSQHAIHNWGPEPFALESRPTGAHDSPAEDSATDPVWLSRTLFPGFDQCVFVRGYHMKRRRLSDEQDEGLGEDEGKGSWRSDSSEYVVEVIGGSDQPQEPSACVHVLDYILEEDPAVKLAMVHDDAVTPYLQASLSGQSVVSLLAKYRPQISLLKQNGKTTGILRAPSQGDSADMKPEASHGWSVFHPHQADEVSGNPQ